MTTKNPRGDRDRLIAARLGATFRARRLRLQLSQGQVVERVLGLSASGLSQIETGKRGEQLAVGMWIDLAKAVGWTLGELVRAAFPRGAEDDDPRLSQ